MKEVLSYLLSIGGAGIVAYAVSMAMAVNCDYPSARFRIINSLRTQPWQAEVMTKTKPGSFYEGIHSAMKIGGSMGLRDPTSPTPPRPQWLPYRSAANNWNR